MAATDTGTARRLAHKLYLYADEARFAATSPATLREKFSLAASTVEFHYRNWRKLPHDAGPRLSVDLDIEGYPVSLTLRPHYGDLAILYEVFAQCAYELDATELPPQSVRCVIDAGANIGFASLFLAARYPNARIFAVEPHPDNFALLRANTASEPRILPVAACLTGTPGQEVFITTEGRGSHFQMNRAGEGVRVPGTTIEELIAEHGFETIDLLKIDIEGAEREVFANGAFLARTRAIVAELHGSYDLDQFNADIGRWGMTARVSEFAGEPNTVIATRKA